MTRLGHTLPRMAPPRKWVTLFALLAFFLQSLAVQVHIHQQVLPQAAKSTTQPATPPLKNQDPVDQCRLCQELAHAGTFITPSAAFVWASLALVGTVLTPSPLAIVSLTRPFAWQGRAPPR